MLFKAVVVDVWKRREQSAREDRARQVEALRVKLDRLDDLLTDGVLDAETYQRQRKRLRAKVDAAEVEFDGARIEHLDVDAVFAFAQCALGNASRMWEHASPDHKRRLQAVYFPDGLAWDAGGTIRTLGTSSAFKELQALADPERRLASPTGFEPAPPRSSAP